MKPVILESPYAARDPRLHPEEFLEFQKAYAWHVMGPYNLADMWAAEDVKANVTYACTCLRDSLQRGEAPIASHLLYPQVLDDNIPEHRQMGIDAGLAWRARAHYAVFYVDRGWSRGMTAAYDLYVKEGVPFEIRRLTPGEAKGP